MKYEIIYDNCTERTGALWTPFLYLAGDCYNVIGQYVSWYIKKYVARCHLILSIMAVVFLGGGSLLTALSFKVLKKKT